jgi:phage-related protein
MSSVDRERSRARRHTWPVRYYRAVDGSQPADESIDAQPRQAQAMIDNYLGRLALFGPSLPFPSSSQVEGELRELRPDMGRTHYRLLYGRSDDLFIILHAFIKRGGQIDQAELDIANRRWQDPRDRMNADPRRPPSPIGRTPPRT